MDSQTTSIRRIADEAAQELAWAAVPEPQASAEILLSELLGIRRGDIPFHRETLTREQHDEYADMVSRRKNREPVQRILGHAYFRNLKLTLNEATLIPRPDTECIVDLALKVIDEKEVGRVLDLGTGTGAIAISIAQERPGVEVYASDINSKALEAARSNAEENGVSVDFFLSDIASDVRELDGSVELLVSNPPYIETAEMQKLQPEVREHDPSSALEGGTDGLGFYRRIFQEAGSLLADDADVILEVGDGQAEQVLSLGEETFYTPLGTHPDLTGKVRAVHLRWSGGGV